jgi:hypothetical protein
MTADEKDVKEQVASIYELPRRSLLGNSTFDIVGFRKLERGTYEKWAREISQAPFVMGAFGLVRRSVPALNRAVLSRTSS